MKTTLITLLATAILGYCQESASQEASTPAAETVATAATLPVTRTITDLKGRSMEGTILSKTEPNASVGTPSISFVRAADQKKFEIALDTLSDTDKAFVASIVVKKPNVLLIGLLFTDNFGMTLDLIKKEGFDVTVGVCPRLLTGNNTKADFERISKTERAIMLTVEDATNPAYDIIWIQDFPLGARLNLDINLREVAKRGHEAGKLVVIKSPVKTPTPELFMEADAYKTRNADTSLKAKERVKREKLIDKFVIPYENKWVFYDFTGDAIQTSKGDFYAGLPATVKETYLNQ